MRNDLLLLSEVAAEARVSVSTVRHWIRVGKLRTVRPGRRRMKTWTPFSQWTWAPGHTWIERPEGRGHDWSRVRRDATQASQS